VTDNYQGEENDIIILSLVRSNPEKKIGFLKTHNRICVALSRARCGLFVIGNMNLLAEVEEMWKKIVKSLFESNEVGTGELLSSFKWKLEVRQLLRFMSFLSSTFKRKILC
jgi:superfamily I DNA and/or RNA helicase